MEYRDQQQLCERTHRYLQGCDLSPTLRSYVTSCLRQLTVNNPEIRVDEPFHPGAVREPRTLASPGDTAQKAESPDMPHGPRGRMPLKERRVCAPRLNRDEIQESRKWV
jgi:hypothetical protein